MEIIGWIFVIVVVWIFIRRAMRTEQEKGDAVENTEIAYTKDGYFGPPQVKFIDEKHKKSGYTVKRIMFRGRIPNDWDMDVAFTLSALDVTGSEDKPVFSLVEAAREPDTICYQVSGSFGHVSEGSVITNWVNLGNIVPELIRPPYSGEREIHVFLRMFDSTDPPTIYGGFSHDDGDIIFSEILRFNFGFEDKGYEEASKDREESQAISLKIGVAVAMSDGSLDDLEGKVLKNWIVKEISGYSGSQQKKLKSLFNEALKEGFEEARKGYLSLSDLADRLNEIGDKKSKYDAIELCLDVMAADGVADPEEMAVIRNMARSLNLDMDEIEKMREKVTLNLSTELTSEKGMEALVGIEPSWSDAEKRKHLRTEFQKWSNRLNSLPEGEERESAQNMLDNIAILRKKYD